MKICILFVVIFLAFVSIESCDEPVSQHDTPAGFNIQEDSLLSLNKELIQAERQEIEDFINRYRWNMNKTSTGLRYMIYKTESGIIPGKGASVSISYSVKLLNGDLVFQSDSTKPVTFIVGKRKVPSGLEEGVLLMKQGEAARLIVPSHLAYGLLGDLEKIPNRAVLLYDVKLHKVENLDSRN